MQGFVEAHSDLLQFYAVIGVFLVAICWESVLPRRGLGRALHRRWLNNIGLTVLNHVFTYWAEIALVAALAWFAFEKNLGLLNSLELSFPVQLVITVLALEFISYVMHRLLHQVPMLWRLHRVHHADTEVDFSTTFRNHPLEILLLLLVSGPFILLLGLPVNAVVLYHLARVSVNIIGHGNVLIPERIDAGLRLLVVTPDFHRMHHSSDRRFTDSNYGALLPWYDYLFGTATRKPFDEVRDMQVGLEEFRSEEEMRMDRLLTMPFRNPAKDNPRRAGDGGLANTGDTAV